MEFLKRSDNSFELAGKKDQANTCSVTQLKTSTTNTYVKENTNIPISLATFARYRLKYISN